MKPTRVDTHRYRSRRRDIHAPPLDRIYLKALPMILDSSRDRTEASTSYALAMRYSSPVPVLSQILTRG